MIRELTCASVTTEAEVLSAFSVVDVADIAWPLPNMEAVSPGAYWNAFIAGEAKALIDIGHKTVDGEPCTIFATFEEKQRGGVAAAINRQTLEARFFTWSECEHVWKASHNSVRSLYRCRKCGHSYRIAVEG